jgi:N-acetylmuramoyl-L-alanine amidase
MEILKVPEGFEGSPQRPREDLKVATPNVWRRNSKVIDRIVIHATAGTTVGGALSRVTDPKSEASYHVIVSNPATEGKLISVRVVHDEFKAGGVRKQCKDPIDGKTDINSRALHLAFVHTAGDAPYPKEQVELGIKWVHWWCHLYPIAFIYSHALVDPLRRKDPGKTFPWHKLKTSLEVSPKKEHPDIFIGSEDVTEELDPELYEGAIYVKLRPLLVRLGVSFSYDPATKTVRIDPSKRL